VARGPRPADGVIGVLCLVGHYGQVRVLVVEDNHVVAQTVAEGLRDQGLAVDVAGDGAAGLEKAGLVPYGAISRPLAGTSA
jgi:hypothetical protein